MMLPIDVTNIDFAVFARSVAELVVRGAILLLLLWGVVWVGRRLMRWLKGGE